MDITQILGKISYTKADLDVKAKELNIKGRSKLSKTELESKIIEYTLNPELQKQKTTKTKKQTIPKVLKIEIWDTHIGNDKRIGNCYCCKKEIDCMHFECGHIIPESKGGDLSITNLRPVCSLCNKSIGNKNMDEFIELLQKNEAISKIKCSMKFNEFLQKYKIINIEPTMKYNFYDNNNNNNECDNMYDNDYNSMEGIMGYNKRRNMDIRALVIQKNIEDNENLYTTIDYSNIFLHNIDFEKIYIHKEDLNSFKNDINITLLLDEFIKTVNKTHTEIKSKYQRVHYKPNIDTNFVHLDIQKILKICKDNYWNISIN